MQLYSLSAIYFNFYIWLVQITSCTCHARLVTNSLFSMKTQYYVMTIGVLWGGAVGQIVRAQGAGQDALFLEWVKDWVCHFSLSQDSCEDKMRTFTSPLSSLKKRRDINVRNRINKRAQHLETTSYLPVHAEVWLPYAHWR